MNHQTMHCLVKRFFYLFLFFFLAGSCGRIEAFPFSFLNTNQDFSVMFLKSDEAVRKREHAKRKEQLASIQAEKAAFSLQVSEQKQLLTKRLESLEEEKSRLKRGTFLYKQCVDVLHDRTKNVEKITTLYQLLEKRFDERIDLLNKFIGTLEKDLKNKSTPEKESEALSWTEFKNLQQEVEELVAKKENQERDRDAYIRTQAQLIEDNSKKKREAADKEAEKVTAAQAETDVEQKEALEKLALYLGLLAKETGELYDLIEKQAALKLGLQEDSIALQNYILNKKQKVASIAPKRIVFSSQDKELARQDLKAQQEASVRELALIDSSLAALKNEEDRLSAKIARLKLSETSSPRDEAYREKLEREKRLVEEKVTLEKYKREFEAAKEAQKQLKLEVIKTMHQRAIDLTGKTIEEHIDQWLHDFVKHKEQVNSFLETLNYRANENRSSVDALQKYSGIVASKTSAEDARIASLYKDIIALVKEQNHIKQEIFSVNSQQIKQYETMKTDINFILKELDRDKRSLNIWQRSDQAVTRGDLVGAYKDFIQFSSYMGTNFLRTFSPSHITQTIALYSFSDLFLLLIFFFLLFFFITFFSFGVAFVGRHVDQLLYYYQGQVWAIYFTVLRSFVRFVQYYSRGIAIWLFLRLHIAADFGSIFYTITPFISRYAVCLFYLLSIPFFIYISQELMREIKKINQRMSFLFFTEKLQERFLFLLTLVLFASAAFLPVVKSFLYYAEGAESSLPKVVYAAWSLVISLVVLFGCKELLRLIPSHLRISQWFLALLDKYYYPVFLFIIGLLVLSNPYVGYSNFAVYLAMSIPASVVIFYVLFTAHSYVRKYSFFIFMKEDENEPDEVEDRFEHAKMYYGFFIVFTFLAFLAGAFILMTHIWGIDYTFAQLWKGLSQDWVLSIGDTGDHIGFGGLLTLVSFILGGFVTSSLFHRFVLSKLFEVFRTAYGAQNTTSRITHYLIICLAVILGLYAIKLTQLVTYVLLALGVGISFGAKDLVADFFAGLWILIERPIEPGNFIETGDLRGTVLKIAVRATTIKTARNFSVVIPNRELISKPIINWGAGYYAVGFEFTVLLPFTSDALEMKDLIAQVVSSHKLVLRVPQVCVRCEDFEENGVRFFVRAFVSSRRLKEQWEIASDVRIALLSALKEHDIKIPYPQRVVQNVETFSIDKKQLKEMLHEDASGDGGDDTNSGSGD